MKIKIKWLLDQHDCETCGSSYATGAQVQVGDTSLLFEPSASCFVDDSWTEVQVYEKILEHLGYTLEVSDYE